MRNTFTLVVLFFSSLTGYSQQGFEPDTTGKKTAWVETIALASTVSETPFWLQANSWGIMPVSGPALGIRIGGEISTLSKNKNWRLTSGLEIAGNLAKQSEILIPEAYVSGSFKFLTVTAGRRKQYYDFTCTNLGTGAYLFSSNALPIPVIELAVIKYTPVPFTARWVYFKGSYSDGWFEKGREVTSELKLHHKSIYLRVGKPTGHLKFHGGFRHVVQWGGKSPYETLNGQMPTGFKNYWYAVSGRKPNGKLQNGSHFDNTNRVGNHLASIDYAAEWENDKVSVFLYRQQFIEDGSLFYFMGWEDGLTGLQLTLKKQNNSFFAVKSIAAEFLYSKDQGGSEWIDGTNIRGRDNYFNNAQVRDGWSYFGRTIGTPFITPSKSNVLPALGGNSFSNNTRVAVAHLGLSGKLGESVWVSKLSYSSNDGTYIMPFYKTINQFSGLISLQKSINLAGENAMGGISLGVDAGELYRPCVGILLSVKKNFF